MSTALSASRALNRGDTTGAQTIVREHMSHGAAKLRENTARGKIGEAIRSDSIAWLVGAVVSASAEGLTAAAALLLTRIGLDASLRPRSTAALKAHYVALSKPGHEHDSAVRLGDPRSTFALAQSRQARRVLCSNAPPNACVGWPPATKTAWHKTWLTAAKSSIGRGRRTKQRPVERWSRHQRGVAVRAVAGGQHADHRDRFGATRLLGGEFPGCRSQSVAPSSAGRPKQASARRPCRNWRTGITIEHLASLNTVSQRWLRWYIRPNQVASWTLW
jgi:hypothetical protein